MSQSSYFERNVMSHHLSTSINAKLKELRSVIQLIEPGIGYSDWITVLMVVFYETQGSDSGLALVDEWSSNGQNYKGFKDVAYRWNRFNLSYKHPVRMGTLKRLAKKYSAVSCG